MSHGGDLCEKCGKDKYSADCPHFNSATGSYNPDGAKEDARSGVGGSDEEAAETNIAYDEIGDCEAIDAACKALDTITAYERDEDMQMQTKVAQARVKRIKNNSIILLDKAISSLREYYDSVQESDGE